VLVEKPDGASTAPDCDALANLAESMKVRAHGRLHVFCTTPASGKMKECMAPEAFGQAYYLHATRTNLGPIRQDVSAIEDLAPHDVAIFNYLLASSRCGRPRSARAC